MKPGLFGTCSGDEDPGFAFCIPLEVRYPHPSLREKNEEIKVFVTLSVGRMAYVACCREMSRCVVDVALGFSPY